MATKFRKKPVEVEAVQLTRDQFAVARDFIPDDQFGGGGTDDQGQAFLLIRTLEGTMRADEGDWIIRGVQGEHYPCKPDIFEATYEPVLRRGCGPDCSEQHTYGAGCAIKPPARAFLGESPCGKPGCPCGSAA